MVDARYRNVKRTELRTSISSTRGLLPCIPARLLRSHASNYRVIAQRA